MSSAQVVLQQLEQLFRRNGYKLRYLRGTFRSAPCRLYQNKLIVLNTLSPPLGRVRALASIAEDLRSTLDITPEEDHLIRRWAS